MPFSLVNGDGSSGFGFSDMTRWLCGFVLDHGVTEGLEAFNGFLSEENCKCEELVALTGINVSKEIELFSGVKLIPVFNNIKLVDKFPSLFREELEKKSASNLRVSAYLHIVTKSPKFITGSYLNFSITFISTSSILLLLSLYFDSAPVQLVRCKTSQLPDFVIKTRGISGTQFDPGYFHPTYDAIIDGFSELYDAYNVLDEKDRKRIDLSLRRLRKSKRQAGLNSSNAFLELGIAVEVLFSGPDKTGEISLRVATRGAWFLGSNYNDRKKIFRTLKWLYNLRSEVAHTSQFDNKVKGNSPYWPDNNPNYILKDATSLCEEAIKKIILQGGFPDFEQLTLGQ